MSLNMTQLGAVKRCPTDLESNWKPPATEGNMFNVWDGQTQRKPEGGARARTVDAREYQGILG